MVLMPRRTARQIFAKVDMNARLLSWSRHAQGSVANGGPAPIFFFTVIKLENGQAVKDQPTMLWCRFSFLFFRGIKVIKGKQTFWSTYSSNNKRNVLY